MRSADLVGVDALKVQRVKARTTWDVARRTAHRATTFAGQKHLHVEKRFRRARTFGLGIEPGPSFGGQVCSGGRAGRLGRNAQASGPCCRLNHAWRHRFKTIAREVGIAPEYSDAITGHEDGRAASDYGETTVKALWREVQKLPRYEVTQMKR